MFFDKGEGRMQNDRGRKFLVRVTAEVKTVIKKSVITRLREGYKRT